MAFVENHIRRYGYVFALLIFGGQFSIVGREKIERSMMKVSQDFGKDNCLTNCDICLDVLFHVNFNLLLPLLDISPMVHGYIVAVLVEAWTIIKLT